MFYRPCRLRVAASFPDRYEVVEPGIVQRENAPAPNCHRIFGFRRSASCMRNGVLKKRSIRTGPHLPARGAGIGANRLTTI